MSEPDRETAARARLAGLERRELDDACMLFTARRFRERSAGLGGLPALPAGWGLQILRCRQVHTVSMRFPLDLLWLDRDGAIVRIDRNVPRWRMRTCLRARTVVEANAGEGDRLVAAGLGREPAARRSSIA